MKNSENRNNKEPYFKNLVRFGDLWLDYVLFGFEKEPLLFICRDINDKLYFCHCYQMIYTQKWYIAPISLYHLMDLIEKKQDVYSVFLFADIIIRVELEPGGEETSVVTNFDDEEKVLDMIKKDVFLETDVKCAMMYVDYIKSKGVR